MTREFTDSIGVRGNVPLLVGLVGPSGSGKTKSSLRLAAGIQRIVGGEIWGIDSEANRMLHYADEHKFRHVPFTAPFDALSYLAAVEYCVKKGAKTIIIDSGSHLHEGPGGTLESHEAECERLMAAWKQPRERVQMAAWQRPKTDLRRFLNTVLQMQVNTIWAFRAKEKLKIIPGQQPRPLGFMPIAGDEMIYEMTLNCLLYPNSGGVPSWHPEEMGERAIVKLPQQFVSLFKEQKPLDEDTGQKLAEWAAGSVPASTERTNADAQSMLASYATIGSHGALDEDAFEDLEKQRQKAWSTFSREQKQQVKEASDAAKARLGTTAKESAGAEM